MLDGRFNADVAELEGGVDDEKSDRADFARYMDAAVAALDVQTGSGEPEGRFGQISIDRFSPMFKRPEQFGIRIEPFRAYRYVYPLPDAEIQNLAYAFSRPQSLHEIQNAKKAIEAVTLEAVNALAARMSPEQRKASCFPVDSPQWRNWQNTELYVEHHGLRLDEAGEPLREAAMAVLRASMSPHGYELSRNVMKLNRFLGDLVGGPAILGEWSYIFCLFGTPSTSEPWGWQFFGHHLVLNCFVLGEQMACTPAFWGAEPNYADHGPFAGIRLFQDEERAGLTLMRSLSEAQCRRAIVAHSMMGGDLPEGRRHFADNLHLGGAFQDNRVVPYDGLKGSELSAAQRRDLMDLVGKYFAVLPDGPRNARMAEVERHLADTHFCWIGGFSEDSPFYYRVHSPVILIEFDHHPGVVFDNEVPSRHHVHTVVRTPNGGDYGADLLRQHHEQFDHSTGHHNARH